MLAGAHKKFYRFQYAKIYLLDQNVQYKQNEISPRYGK